MQKVTIVMYHYVRELQGSRYPNIRGLDYRLFREQIDFLRINYKIIRMQDLIGAASGGNALPENAALLTFDDGYIDHYTYVFPLLDELGIQGSFFMPCISLKHEGLLDVNKIHLMLASTEITKLYGALLGRLDHYRGQEFSYPENADLVKEYAVPYYYDDAETGFVKRLLQTVLPLRLRAAITGDLFGEFVSGAVSERAIAKEMYCSAEQARLMKRHGMYIGVHGYGHEWLGNIDAGDAVKDIQLAVGELESMGLIDSGAWAMNYPYGSWNNDVVNFLRGAGCSLGFTTKSAVAAPGFHDRLRLPRIDTNEFPPKSERYKEIGVE